jgi:hypothetical protein
MRLLYFTCLSLVHILRVCHLLQIRNTFRGSIHVFQVLLQLDVYTDTKNEYDFSGRLKGERTVQIDFVFSYHGPRYCTTIQIHPLCLKHSQHSKREIKVIARSIMACQQCQHCCNAPHASCIRAQIPTTYCMCGWVGTI